ncbi:MAG: glycosyltransferase family 4 protein [Lachnospiraceae bacterium]|nr:glycosyltransferase family 4 protein [Candidatus Colinaster equi]
MRKILILSNSSSGLYEFRSELIDDFLEDSKVYISLPDEEVHTKLLQEKGCEIIHTPFERRGMNPVKDIKLMSKYMRLLAQIKPDVVCTYTIKPNIYGGLACRIKGIPYMTNITGLGTALQNDGLLSKILICMYKAALKKAKCVFFQNEYNLEFMCKRGVVKGKTVLLPGSGVNLMHHIYKDYPSEDEGIRILSVLRIMKDKGIEELIEAADRFGSSQVKFVLAGKYEEESKAIYEPQIERLVSEGKMEYLGYVNEMRPVYASSHIILHPSYHEGLSNVCLEAAACGRPVLTTNVPGCAETVVDGESGILFEAASKDAIVAALDIMLTHKNKEDRSLMGKNGRKHVEDNFSRQIVIDKYRKELC